MFLAEQVSTSPLTTAFFFGSPQNSVQVRGNLVIKSAVFWNSVAALLDESRVEMRFAERPDEDYRISLPNVYLRGLYVGSLFYELGDKAKIECPALDLVCELAFEFKAWRTLFRSLLPTV